MTEEVIGENFGLLSPERIRETSLIGGLNRIVNEIIELLTDIDSPEDKREFHGAFLIISLPGEPIQTIAEKVAKTLELPLVTFQLGEIIEKNKLDALMTYANTNAPCILYLPRLEDIAPSSSINAIKLYEWLSSANLEDNQIITIAQTSNPEKIDAGVLSSFDLHIPLPPPDDKDRENLLKQFFEERAGELADAVNLTEGWSYGDLNRLIKYVKVKSKKEHISLISIIRNNVLPISQKYHRMNLSRWGQGRDNPPARLIEQLIPEELIEQYYLMAVSENPNQVHRVIQNLNDGFPLDEKDQEILAKYPFLLIGPPRKRIERLAAAKRQLNTIERLVGGDK